MKLFPLIAAAAVALTVAWAPKAEAAYYDGVASTSLNVRAGPSANYPMIGRIRAGSPLNVRGCVRGYAWCDVSTGGFRGWVPAKYIRGSYNRRTDNISVLGRLLGLNVVSYDEPTYWGQNYYSQDFYRTKYGWNDNNARRYGWKRVNNKWVRRDEDHDGIPNKYDRRDNDGRGRWDSDRPANSRDEDHDGVPNSRDNWDNDGRGRWDDDRQNRRYND
ncbi:MAG TPA: SH3 domain-containing protein [Patescibacteria group bacterium]|nr:SH3 domain-containing protein [Patescibacteria group bacterium]